MAMKFCDLEEIGRIQLSSSFYLRDFLHSEIASFYRIRNSPVNIELAVHTGRKLCEHILEPLQQTFGRIHIRSGYRSPELNAFGNARGLKCSSNERSFADHIWDVRDAEGNAGACACIVIPWFSNRRRPDEWPELARWLAQHLDFHRLVFFGRQTSFNIGWRENPKREISSYRSPRGNLTRRAHAEGWFEHPVDIDGFPALRGALTPVDEAPWRPDVQPVAQLPKIACSIGRRRDHTFAAKTHMNERTLDIAPLLF